MLNYSVAELRIFSENYFVSKSIYTFALGIQKEANNCSLLSFWCNCSNNLCARLIQPRLGKKAYTFQETLDSKI